VSRYILAPRDPATATEVVVGWDPPLKHFFGHVYDERRPESDDECVVDESFDNALDAVIFADKYAADSTDTGLLLIMLRQDVRGQSPRNRVVDLRGRS
jgi:hypothetical protein